MASCIKKDETLSTGNQQTNTDSRRKNDGRSGGALIMDSRFHNLTVMQLYLCTMDKRIQPLTVPFSDAGNDLIFKKIKPSGRKVTI